MVLRSICKYEGAEYVGQSNSPLGPIGTVAFVALPLASVIEITGVLLMMKLPQIFWNVYWKFGVGGSTAGLIEK